MEEPVPALREVLLHLIEPQIYDGAQGGLLAVHQALLEGRVQLFEVDRGGARPRMVEING